MFNCFCNPSRCCNPCQCIGTQGPRGPQGPPGPPGAVGKGLQIDGHVDKKEDLPNGMLENGLAYTVGSGNPSTELYVYDSKQRQWIDEGALRGPKGADGITPQIGENGNWWYNDEDTGIRAVGEDGKNGFDGDDGITPDIGENGNWWLNGEDTGIRAVGVDGKNGFNGDDGITPKIGANGNWWIADTDTGKPSRGEKGESGAEFYPAFCSYYATDAQVFPARPLEYSYVKWQGMTQKNITLQNETDIIVAHRGIYQISYTLTAGTKTDDATVAILLKDGRAKSNSVQSIKAVGTQTSMTFITSITNDEIIRLGVLTKAELGLENVASNLVNASIEILQINV